MSKIRIYSLAKDYGKNDDMLDALMNCHSLISDENEMLFPLFQMKKRRI